MIRKTNKQRSAGAFITASAEAVGHSGTARLAVFRSEAHIYAQIIDDAAGRTLAALRRWIKRPRPRR